tara:strand:- start:1065 stop:1400 length:336 start_codon:yes stop_codon:yes gene_type:complete
MLEFYGHIYAFVASLSRVLYMLFLYKNKVDRKKAKWDGYLYDQWDDILAALLFPQFFCFGYEAGFSIWAFYKGEEEWKFFYDTHEGVNIIFGLFGVLLYTRLLKKGEEKIR